MVKIKDNLIVGEGAIDYTHSGVPQVGMRGVRIEGTRGELAVSGALVRLPPSFPTGAQNPTKKHRKAV